MLHIVMMMMIVLLAMASASVKSTITSLKLASNYTSSVRALYRDEGIAEYAVWALKAGQDLDINGVEDFQQVHGNGTAVLYTYGAQEVIISRAADDPHVAVITSGRVTIRVNNFPGGGQSCQNNNQCTPERVAWYSE